MKKIIYTSFIFLFAITINAQEDKTNVLQNLENDQTVNQNVTATATLKSASRLFADKNDLTSVILVIPEGSSVDVLGSDDTYLHVIYEENEGYIYANQAVVTKNPVAQPPAAIKEAPIQKEMPVRRNQITSRFSYLEDKYGSSVGQKIYEGKIWKGMSSEMIKDSWGSPRKINKVLSGNIVKEEWTYRDTWLYIQNNTLTDWGSIK